MKNLASNIFLYFLSTFLLLSSQVFAVTISPTTIDINPNQKIVTLTFVNDTGREINIQSSTLSWKQVNGKDVYSPSNDLIVVPAIVTIPGGKSQNFRITKRVLDSSEVEQSYRLYLEDITPDFTDPKKTDPGIFFKFNQNLPVYYYTGKPNPKNSLKVSFCSADSKQTCVRIDNSENVRAILNNISFKSPDNKPLENVDANVNGTILSNSWKEFRFNTPANKSNTLIIKSSFGDFEVPYKK
ncbi:MAG: molecular chaperone [Actinobacteria bacterium]|jgi:fimbrial chaperone protein|nr:molecular chaperone [Actinomycetota bacterium]NCX76151.1 molecular chaperone [Actinomycetota bacterium]NKA16479.1 molecular chaperone [Candidatus Fonsibacter sp. PEL55]